MAVWKQTSAGVTMAAISAAESHEARQASETESAQLTLVPAVETARTSNLPADRLTWRKRRAYRKAAVEADLSGWY